MGTVIISPVGENESGLSDIASAAIAVALVLLFVAAYLLFRRMSRDEEGPPAEIPPEPPATVSGRPDFCTQCGMQLGPADGFCRICGQPADFGS